MNLLSKIRTTEERDKLELELDLLLSNLYEHQGTGLDSALRTKVRNWVATEIRTELPDVSDVGLAQNYIKNLKGELSKLKTLKLKIAFEPTDSSIDKFSDFAHRYIGRDVLIDFEIDPQIFGGAEITYEGEYRDLSLKRLFESEYKEKEAELQKLLTSTRENAGN